MNKLNIFKKATLGLTTFVAALFFTAGVVGAIPYDNAQTNASPVPAFNVFTGVPAPWGNESDFLRARVPVAAGDSTTQYTDPLNSTCKIGETIQMRVYVHNGASVSGNANGSGPSVAHGTKVKVTIPGTESATFSPSASISATNAATVNDGATINCNGHKVKLSYVAGSASQYSIGSGVVALSDSIVTSGVSVRSHTVAGDVWGCWDDRVYVILSVKVVEIPVPPVVAVLKCTIKGDEFVFEQAKRKVTVGITANVTNATVTGYNINWGDNTSSTKQSDSHTYAASVTSAKITASFTARLADGSVKTVSDADCVKQIAFVAVPQPPVKPEVKPVVQVVDQPTILPVTGIGSTALIFGATSAITAGAYRWFLGRRLNSN